MNPIAYSPPRISAQVSSPDRDVARRQRRRQDRREGLVVVELEEEVERALADRPVHRGAGQQRRRDEQLVRDRLAARARDRPDERAEPEADREQVEQRLEEARQDDEPAVLVDVQVALDQAQRAAARRSAGRWSAGRRSSAHQLGRDQSGRRRTSRRRRTRGGSPGGRARAGSSARRRSSRATARGPARRRATAA